MASITGSDLRCRVEVLRRTAVTNALDETDYTYAPERKVWARIVPSGTSRVVSCSRCSTSSASIIVS